ncbi:formate/nitrite transporter family protein [Pseudonocardia kujensis]|uniref:formate/nitrite transporter family protein n=1 Tax=Pseudonocardia kujensis TaxID=1128675 RepID=UPI001E5C5D0A|nr:formate/nitrite transporter family protein [Pseudonocardia kujensis]MCE0761602.1 formate/nitrite transporter family protein [Pseudonocardia kujensis]
MPIPVTQAVAEQATTARSKAESTRNPARYLVSGALAGAYVGVAVVLMVMATGPLNAAQSPFTKLAQGLVFGIALTLVVFAGAELCTGNMMTMVLGLFDRVRGTGPGAAGAVILFSFVANLVGSIVFAWLVHTSGVLDVAASPGAPAPGATMLAALVKAKAGENVTTMFFRGVLCNFLVCLGVWMAGRTRSDGAKLVVLFWALLAFITSGFDHVVANMTIFSLGEMAGAPGATLGTFAENMLVVGLGNLVGGGLLVGAAYGLVGRTPAASGAEPAHPANAEPALTAATRG